MANFDTMWDTYRDFRSAVYVTSYFWAALLVLQAGGTALIVDRTTYSTAYTYNEILPLVATALGIIGSIAIGGRHRLSGLYVLVQPRKRLGAEGIWATMGE